MVYPFDTVRRRMMMLTKGNKFYSSSWDCTRKIFARHGIMGFYKGALTNLFLALGNAVVLISYDSLRSLFD